MWDNQQIQDHLFAAKKLLKIKDEVFNLIKTKKNLSEYEIQQFILSSYKKEGLKSEAFLPFVAFDENIATPYTNYKASNSKKIGRNTLILIDIWARKNTSKAPFSDMSWVAYKGKKIPKKIISEFKATIKVRDKIIKYIRQQLNNKRIPSGEEIDFKVREYLTQEGHKGKTFTGHCLGLTSAHGNKGDLTKGNKKPLITNLGYALEPGMYSKGKYWIRNEINFYISKKNKLIITTDLQKKIIKLS